MNKNIACSILWVLFAACSLHPGSLKKIPRHVSVHSSDFSNKLHEDGRNKLQVLYLGCGGVYLAHDQAGILLDPFFSNQPASRIGKSVLLGKKGKKNLRTDKTSLANGMAAVRKVETSENATLLAVLNAHSHYDHLMDIPAVLREYRHNPRLFLTSSGFNICHQVIDTTNVTIVEKYMSTFSTLHDPIMFSHNNKTVKIYPVLGEHNPHYRNLKFFAGEQTRPVADLKDPFQKTKANLWLEGNTFSFLIDFLDEEGGIELRVFIQSSSCNAPSGIPPREVLDQKEVDLALIGIASYSYSPDYPCELLQAINPRQIIWTHWEDFFRDYSKSPKTLRGTDVPKFFELPCVLQYKNSGKLLWPRVKMELVY